MAEKIDKLDKAHQEDQAKLTAVETQLAAVQKAHDQDQAKFAAIQKAHSENQAQLGQQIHKLQRENASLQDHKQKMTRKMEELGSLLEQG